MKLYRFLSNSSVFTSGKGKKTSENMTNHFKINDL